MHIAMLGTRGIPARYGGFETAVEEIGVRLVEAGHRVTVYCRDEATSYVQTHRGIQRVVLPAIKHRALETLSHTAASTAHAILRARPDCAFVFNAANAPFLPSLRLAGIPTAIHLDGLEWKRGKWGRLGRSYYRVAERLAVKWSDFVIADALAISAYVSDTYGRSSWFIPYGAAVVKPEPEVVVGLGLRPGEYHLAVARFEPENNLHVIVRGYLQSAATFPLVLVGDNPYGGSYRAELLSAAASDARVKVLGSVWDQHVLDQLYANATSYLHGHSVGGTNPSLLRAMGAASPVTAFDVVFNREVTGDLAKLFTSAADVAQALEEDERHPSASRARGESLQARAINEYRWDSVARTYEALAVRLTQRSRPLRSTVDSA